MREVELKGVITDVDAFRVALLKAGAELTYVGRLEDKRYDSPERTLALRDHVLRLRVYRGESTRALLDWKGPTAYENGYKVREEYSVPFGGPAAAISAADVATDADTDVESLTLMLARLGYEVTREIDREIEQFVLFGATVRIERYPRMDVLAEVEGAPAAIEQVIGATGVPRTSFTAQRLPDFIREYEARTGERAAICDRELLGEYLYSATDA